MTQGVSRQLIELGFDAAAQARLEVYARLLRQWNGAINLIAPATINDLWHRHLLDSAQIWPILREFGAPTCVNDLGSGGGLPGLVLAMAGADHVTMIESDTRKGIYLKEVSRETSLSNTTIVTARIEQSGCAAAPFVTARALAPLAKLMEWAAPLWDGSGAMIFPKGKNAADEVAALDPLWRQRVELRPSITDAEARIVVIKGSM